MSLRTTVGSAAISTVGARCLPVRVRTQTGIEPVLRDLQKNQQMKGEKYGKRKTKQPKQII